MLCLHCVEAHPLTVLWLSQWGLLDPTKPEYNKSRQVLLPAFLDTVPTVSYSELTASFINFLHYCLAISGFCGAGKIRDRRTNNLRGCHPHQDYWCTHLHHPPFLHWMPFLPQPSQFILPWDRHQIMLACIPGGLVYGCKWSIWNYFDSSRDAAMAPIFAVAEHRWPVAQPGGLTLGFTLLLV